MESGASSGLSVGASGLPPSITSERIDSSRLVRRARSASSSASLSAMRCSTSWSWASRFPSSCACRERFSSVACASASRWFETVASSSESWAPSASVCVCSDATSACSASRCCVRSSTTCPEPQAARRSTSGVSRRTDSRGFGMETSFQGWGRRPPRGGREFASVRGSIGSLSRNRVAEPHNLGPRGPGRAKGAGPNRTWEAGPRAGPSRLQTSKPPRRPRPPTSGGCETLGRWSTAPRARRPSRGRGPRCARRSARVGRCRARR